MTYNQATTWIDENISDSDAEQVVEIIEQLPPEQTESERKRFASAITDLRKLETWYSRLGKGPRGVSELSRREYCRQFRDWRHEISLLLMDVEEMVPETNAARTGA